MEKHSMDSFWHSFQSNTGKQINISEDKEKTNIRNKVCIMIIYSNWPR